MNDKIKVFWLNHRNTIKNVIILVSVPVAGLALYGINRLNKIIDENGLIDLFYGDEEEEA